MEFRYPQLLCLKDFPEATEAVARMLVENGAVLKATQAKQIARRHPDKKKILEILKGMPS